MIDKAPPIDRKRLAEQVLQGQRLKPHERLFIANMLREKQPQRMR